MATDYATREAAYIARKEQLHAIAPEVCALLGEGWPVAPSKHPAVEGDGFLLNYVDLNGPDGAQISLSAGSSWDTKGSATGYLNDRHNGYQFWYLPHGVNRPSIGITMSRGAKAIANEIKRRILPDYLPLLAACNEARKAHLAELASAEEVARELADVIGTSDYARDSDRTRYDVRPYHSTKLKFASFDCKVSGDYRTTTYQRDAAVRFDRLEVSPKVAAEILAVLVRNHKPEQE